MWFPAPHVPDEDVRLHRVSCPLNRALKPVKLCLQFVGMGLRLFLKVEV